MYNSNKHCKHYTKNNGHKIYRQKIENKNTMCSYVPNLFQYDRKKTIYNYMHMYSSVIYIVDVRIINVHPESR